MRVITVARKPLAGSVAQTALKYGTGGLNIDGCRIPMKSDARAEYEEKRHSFRGVGTNRSFIPFNVSPVLSPEVKIASSVLGRFPANLILQHLPECQEGNCAEGCPVANLSSQSGWLHPSGNVNDFGEGTRSTANLTSLAFSYKGQARRDKHDSGGTAARFFKQVKE